MGDIADDIMEGIFCRICGCVMDDMVPGNTPNTRKEPPGYPRMCDDCKRDDKPRPGAWRRNQR